MPARSRDRLRAAQVLAALADGVLTSALPLLTATVTRDPFAVSLVVAAQRVPGAVVAAGGRFGAIPGDDRTAAALLTTVRAVVAGGLVLTELAGGPRWVVLMVAAAVLGHAQALDDARPHAAGGRAVAAHGAGIPLGAVLFSLTAPAPFALDVPLLAAAGLVALSGRPRREPRPAPPPAPATGGGRLLLTDARLATTTLARATGAAGTAAALGVVVLLALEVLGVGAVGFGLLLAVLAAGSVFGIGAAPLLARGAPGRLPVAASLFVAAVAVAGASALDDPILAATALSGGLAAATCGGVLALAAAHDAAHQATDGTGSGGGPPEPPRGRDAVLRAQAAVVAAAGAAGAATGGATAATWGLPAAYVTGGGLLGVAALAALFGKMR